MPAKKEQVVSAPKAVSKEPELIPHLLSLEKPIQDELENQPDRIKAGLTSVARGIQQLRDNLDTERRLVRPDAGV